MNTTSEPLLPPGVMAGLKAAADHAAEYAKTGKRDTEAMKKAFEEMDRIREQIFQREGMLNIGVDIIREFRDR